MAAAANIMMAEAPEWALVGPKRKGDASADGEKDAKSKKLEDIKQQTLKLQGKKGGVLMALIA
eukprot:6926434-Pyramimonas_sp.AAC.1